MNVSQILTLTAKKFPGRIAILFENQRFNYQEFNYRVNQFSHVLLKMGLRKGEKVAVLLINSNAFIETEVLGENHTPLKYVMAVGREDEDLQSDGP